MQLFQLHSLNKKIEYKKISLAFKKEKYNENCQIVKRKTYKCKLHEKSTLNYLDMQLGKIIKHSNTFQ